MLMDEDQASKRMHPYGSASRCVLHVDVDSFFCQVEVLRNPSLAGMPMAIQQHQDVIAVNYPAKQAGVRKHMAPAQARAILSAAGGRLVHVFTEPDGRVSYRPYREASAALMRLLSSGLPTAVGSMVQVVEKASIDEAYLQLELPADTAKASAAITLADMTSWVATSSGLTWGYTHATAVAETMRTAVKQQLGLTVSVGLAPNKLLAKLASRQAKPDGVHVVDGVAAVQQLLADTPVDRLPGLGGAVAAALTKLGISHVSQLQPHSPDALAALLGGQQQARLAARLVELGWGRDESAVVNKGPPKSIQVQMTLTPQARPLPPSLTASGRQPVAGQPAAAAGGGGGGMMLHPLLTGAADTLPRLSAVLGAMTGDLLGRVLLDRHSEDRWPRKLSVSLTTSGHPPRTATRSTAFPTPALAKPDLQHQARSSSTPHTNSSPAQPAQVAAAAAAPAAAAAAPAAAAAAAFAAPGVVSEKRFAVGSALHDAVLAAATALGQALLSPLPANHPVTILNLSASNFVAFEAAAASGDIRRFTTTAAAAQPPGPTAAAAAKATAAAAAATGSSMAAAISTAGTPLPLPASTAAAAAAAAAALGSNAAAAISIAQAPPPLPAGTAAAAATAPQAEVTAVDLHHQQQQQWQQQRQHGQHPAPVSAVASAVMQQPPKRKHLEATMEVLPGAAVEPSESAAAAAAAGTGAGTAVQRPPRRSRLSAVRDKPPVLLSDVLLHLASSSTTAEAAEEQLGKLLAAAGNAPHMIKAQVQQQS